MNRAVEMRTAFDCSFAQAHETCELAQQDFLAIRVAADPYAIRLADIAGLYVDRRITRLPSTDPAFIGIAGLRGALVPVYDLAALLGHPSGESCRWLLLIGGTSLGLSFEKFEGHLRGPAAAVSTQVGERRTDGMTQELLHLGDAQRPLIQVSALFHSIEEASRHRRDPQDQESSHVDIR
jgi:purine-binding chemotaxis protein CheW